MDMYFWSSQPQKSLHGNYSDPLVRSGVTLCVDRRLCLDSFNHRRRSMNETTHPFGSRSQCAPRTVGPGSARCGRRRWLPPGLPFHGSGTHVVFVQTDNTAGNQVAAYDRADNGTLTLENTYNTGGMGGALNGSHVDHLGSQGSLTYDPRNDALYAVNAGSNTVSVFSVQGDDLTPRQVVN